jgi:hypothetical protein
MAQEVFPLDDPVFSQVELCEVAGITMTTANNWILGGALLPAEQKIRRARKPRLFSINMIFQARMTAKLVEEFGGAPSTAASAAAAVKSTIDGHNWMWSVARAVERSRVGTKSKLPFPDYYVMVFWSSQCRGYEALLGDASKNILKFELDIVAKREPRFADRPQIVLQVSNDFAFVYDKCTQIFGTENYANGGER